MVHGTYDNPRAGTNSSKIRMKNVIGKVNGNDDGNDDVTYRKYKGKGDVTGVIKETSITHEDRGPVLTKKKIEHIQPKQIMFYRTQSTRTPYFDKEKKSKEKVISQKRADRISKRLRKKNIKKSL